MTSRFLLCISFISISIFCFAQKTNKAYAFTGQSNGNFNWRDIREIDLSTGKVSNTIFESDKSKFSLEISTKKKSALKSEAALPTESMVAAAAYDRKHNKLFFTPMKIGELRWLDLSSKTDNHKFYTLQNQLLNTGNLTEEANQITRMVIASDGNGYAISNNADHLIRFSTGKKTEINDLGKLIDAPANKISIHNKTSWGGDVVSDVYGKLYLFTATQNVFIINIESKVATWLGKIKNLSPTFTVNGAAVDEDDNVVISSANTFEGFYKVNVKELTSVKIATEGQVFNASDLANSNLLYQGQLENEVGTAQLIQKEVIGTNNISVYPNPVIGNQFKVIFNNTKAGKYDIALTDVSGRLIMTKQVNIRFEKQQETVQMKMKPAGGLYLIKIAGAGKKSVFANKIIIN
ncbi:MAG: T9SS type A sorting domain-containing protein [Ginsengibacter sp.]